MRRIGFEALSPPTVLVFSHSFVRRLRNDLRSNFDPQADMMFNLLGDAVIHLYDVSGQTVRENLGVVSLISPEIVILEMGTNDLSGLQPEAIGSEIEELVCLLLKSYSVRVIGVCEVILRVKTLFLTMLHW